MYVTDSLHIDSVDNAEWTQRLRYNAEEIRTRVDFTQIPDIMKEAMIAIEDKRFYEHHGVDWKRTLGAVYGMDRHRYRRRLHHYAAAYQEPDGRKSGERHA